VVVMVSNEIEGARMATIARRAERGLGVAIREGQKNGDVETKHEATVRAALICKGTKSSEDFVQQRVSDLLTKTESTGGRSSEFSVFAMTDDVSDDEQFEEAITEAESEGNLSRANVARKCRCLDCRRPLRAPGSVAAQRGPVCRAAAVVA
jgi:hypothetical protein